MTYDPNKMPTTIEEWNELIGYMLGEEAEKAAADPAYRPKSRAEIEATYACYLPQAQPGIPVPTTEYLFAQLRSYREAKLCEYDVKISQLDRLIRMNPDYAAYTIERSEWDAYAVELCNLPAQEGAPWDGGGSQTPWPVKPA